MNKKVLMAMGLSLAIGFTACKKDEDDNNSVSAPENVTPTPSDADGVCVSIRSASIVEAPVVGSFTQFTGLAVAVFPNGDGTFSDAGAVECNGEGLSQNSNNSYTYTPSTNSPTGLNFDTQNDWDVAGAGSITGFSYSNNTNIPEIGDLTVSGSVDVGSDLDLGIDVNNAETTLYSPDLVYFAVYGPDGSLFEARAGNVTSHTFTTGELGTVGTGSGYVQVTAVKFNEQTPAGQKIYFVNEGVMTKSVTLE